MIYICSFHPSEVKTLIEDVLSEMLDEETYEHEKCQGIVVEITDVIKDKVKALNIPRYKIIVQATIGEMKNQGIRITSRCLWDVDTDNYSSATYKNVYHPLYLHFYRIVYGVLL